MNQYLLSVMQPVGEPPEPGVLAEIGRNLEAFHAELRAAGAWVYAGGLGSPDTAAVVRAVEGETFVSEGPYTGGPYAEGTSYLGGLCIVRAPDPDAALDWGRKAALATTLPIEVRPFHGEAEG
ncbi:YciI family protein [Streptomyces sp. NPDC088725]|uniref:YciI family protein n=1 Tax=Streptomyces sp. NPDC088725 TaxID=3365873 RepID=UPI00381228DD